MTARQRRRTPVFAALAGVVLSAQGQPAPAQLLPGASEIAFTTRQMGVPVEGRFSRFTAQVALDPKRPETGRVVLVVEATSARLGSAELDAEVGKPVWLAVARFPEARFESTAIKPGGSGRFEVAGRLTIKGATRDLVVPVQLAQSGATGTASGTASGSFTIKRLDFKVGEGEWSDTALLANEVVVRFKFALTGLPAP